MPESANTGASPLFGAARHVVPAVERFHAGEVEDPARLRRILNEWAAELATELGELRAQSGMSLLSDIDFETGAAVAVGTAPFPLKVQVPFSVRGAWVVQLTNLTTGAANTTAVFAWTSSFSGGGAHSGLSVDFVTGLSALTSYRLRLAVLRG